MADNETRNTGYKKEFAKWHEIKSATEERDTGRIVIREGAVWFMRVGVNVGSELDGKGDEFIRPVIVVKGINSRVFFGVPVSSKIADDHFRHRFTLLGKPRDAVFSHIRSFDKKRCIRFIAMLDKDSLNALRARIGHMFPQAETPRSLVAIGENPITP